MVKVTDLLHEFQYFFPTKFSEMKEILGLRRDEDSAETICKTSKAVTVSPESVIQGKGQN